MKHLFRTSFLIALVCALSSFTFANKYKEHNKFPVGTTIGYITSTSSTLSGSFRVVVSDTDHTSVIYMVSTVTNAIYQVSGEHDPSINYVSVSYQGIPIYQGAVDSLAGSVPPATSGTDSVQ